MGEIQCIGKGQDTSGKYAECQDHLINKWPFLSKNNRKKKYPDRSHILQNNRCTRGGKLDRNNIQDAGDTHHQRSKKIGPGKPQTKAFFNPKEHQQGNDASERNDGHRAPGNRFDAHACKPPQQSGAEDEQTSCHFFFFLKLRHSESLPDHDQLLSKRNRAAG